ncbi:hypothetical protein GWI33_022555 [Rhynchophorus ferrugineus]|uniref:Uncharacterized protein n=1 Tax=Rhynchophorus ferrugineus TaxID=354439 RepID=A0A834IN12_RHYFE|nr:hypothetical protein GWI33_022555 [Rhynchophorus ferrugineus]
MENPCKPPIEEKLYNCPRIVDASMKNDTQRIEARQVECGKGFSLFGGKKNEQPPPSSPVDFNFQLKLPRSPENNRETLYSL